MMATTGVTQAKSLGEYIYLTGIDTTITVDKTSSCPSVGNITVTHITPDSIGIRWFALGSETSWLVSDGVNEYVATDTMFTFGGLAPNTQYNLTVRALCPDIADTSEAVTSPSCRS